MWLVLRQVGHSQFSNMRAGHGFYGVMKTENFVENKTENFVENCIP